MGEWDSRADGKCGYYAFVGKTLSHSPIPPFLPTAGRISFFHKFGSDLDGNAAAHARCRGTLLFVGRDSSLGRFALSRRNAHIVMDANLRDAEYAVDRFDVTFNPRSNLVRL